MPGLDLLRGADLEVRVFGEEVTAGSVPAPTGDEMRSGAHGCAGILTLVRDQVDADLIDALPGLRVVANYGVGYDNIDIATATGRGIVITNTPDVLTAATADLTMALLLAVGRRLGEGERMVRAGRFGGWDPKMLVGADLEGATLGLVGFGGIGQAVATRALGFGIRLLHTSRHNDPVAAAKVGSIRVELDRLLAEADFVSLHVPLAAETHHLIDETALRRMKASAYLVNTARGPVVDEAALVRALKEGWIAGAGLDVYEREPEVSQGLMELENVVMLPHLGSATSRARSEMSRVSATNLIAVLRGERPPNPVNPEVFDRPGR